MQTEAATRAYALRVTISVNGFDVRSRHLAGGA